MTRIERRSAPECSPASAWAGVLAVVLASALSTAAQAGVGQEPEYYPVRVRVVDAEGLPVDDTLVAFDPGRGARRRSITDADGRTEARLPLGVWDVWVDSGRHPRVFVGPVRVGADGAEPESLEVRLRTGIVLTGRVRFGDGDPVEGARVFLPNYGMHPSGDREATTDGNGRYRLSGLPAGVDFRIEVEHASIPGWADRVEDAERFVRLPRSADGGSFVLRDIVVGARAGSLLLGVRASAGERLGLYLNYDGPERSSDVAMSHALEELPARFDRLRAGPWRATVSSDSGASVELSFEIRPGELTEHRVELPAADESLLVTVVGSDGKPVPEASVSVDYPRRSGGRRETTGADGRVRFEGLLPGPVQVRVSHSDRRVLSRFDRGELFEWVESFATAEVVAGDVPEIRLALAVERRPSFYDLAGRVTDLDGRPVQALVTLQSVPTTPSEAGATGAFDGAGDDGAFLLEELHEGVHLVTVAAAGFETAVRTITVVGDTPEANLDFELARDRTAEAAAAVPWPVQGPPPADASARLTGTSPVESGLPSLHWLSLWSRDCSDRLHSTQSRADGSWEIVGIRPGTYCLQAEWADYTLTTREIAIEAGTARLHVEPAAAERVTVTGSVLDAGTGASTVSLHPPDDRGSWHGPLDADGRFEIDGVPIGEYRLQVTGHRWRPLLERAIEVPMRGPIEVTLPRSRVEGVVRGPDGEPTAAVVSLGPARREGWGMACCHLYAADGRFVFDQVPPGEWSLSAGTNDGGRIVRRQLVVDGDAPVVTRDLTLAERALPGLGVRMRSGQPPVGRIYVRARDGAGTDRGTTIDADELRDRIAIGAGNYEVTARNDYGYEYEVPFVVPGPDLLLPDPEPRGKITVLLPALYDDPTPLAMQIRAGGSQRDVTAVPDPERDEERGVVRSVPLAPGPVAVVVSASDGREWMLETTVIPFETTVLIAR